MLSHFRDLLFIKAAEETWFSFIVYRVAILLLFLYLVDLSLPSTLVQVVDYNPTNTENNEGIKVAQGTRQNASIEVNGRNIQDYNAISAFKNGADLYIHQSFLFGFIKIFHTGSRYTKIWVNSFSPIGIFCFVPIIMFIAFIAYFYCRYIQDFDLVLKISVLELILSIVLLAFMVNA